MKRLRLGVKQVINSIVVPSRVLGTRESMPAARSLLGLLGAALIVAAVVVGGRALLSDPSSRTVTASTAPPPAASASPNARTRVFHVDIAWLSFVLPAGWDAYAETRIINRPMTRYAVLGNGPIDAHLLETSADQQGDWKSIAPERVVLELREQVGGPGPHITPASVAEVAAAPPWPPSGGLDQGFTVYTTRFDYLWRNLELLAHVGPAAPPADRDALTALVTSMSFDAPPDHGPFKEGRVFVAGRVTEFTFGSVTHFDAQQSRLGQGFYLVRGAKHFFAHFDDAYSGFAARRSCPVRFDPTSERFVCDATRDEWDLFGVIVSTEHQYDLGWLGVIVRDGRVFVGGDAFRAGPRQIDEAAERIP